MDLTPLWGFHEPFSSMIHLMTAVVFLIAGSVMIYRARGNRLRTFGLSLYIFCAVFLFSMSGVYHLLEKGTTSNYVLRILDHAGIYLMIAGSFTPIQIILLRGSKRWTILSLIWVLAITGLTLTAIFFKDMPEWLILTFFLSMGWLSLFSVWFIRKIDKTSNKYIFTGGALYTIGAVIDFLRWPILIDGVFGAHEIFHLFITLAALVHLKGIWRISKLPISQKIVVHVKKTPQSIKAYLTTEKATFIAQSEERIHEMVEAWVKEHFLDAFRPSKLKFKYFKEDHLYIDN